VRIGEFHAQAEDGGTDEGAGGVREHEGGIRCGEIGAAEALRQMRQADRVEAAGETTPDEEEDEGRDEVVRDQGETCGWALSVSGIRPGPSADSRTRRPSRSHSGVMSGRTWARKSLENGAWDGQPVQL
jgi:hypothetical protein